MEPGTTRPVCGSAAAAISTLGPSRAAVVTWSGTLTRAALIRKVALPSRTVSPGCRPRRSSTTCSASNPYWPLRGARASARGTAGASTGAPTRGQAASTAFSSTSWRSPDAATSIERICTTPDTVASRARSQSRRVSGSFCEPPSISRSPPSKARPSAWRPPAMAARRVPTAAITATPRARHSSTISSPRTPPRSSRRARRRARFTPVPTAAKDSPSP